MSYILAFDQGTTSSRSILFDREGRIAAIAQKELPQIFPQSGWVEHAPDDIWSTQIDTAVECVERAGVTARDIAGIGITNQRETTIIWDRTTGEPIHNAIVWQDRRTAAACDRIRALHGDTIRQLTGLETDAYFSASKIQWLLDNIPDARRRAEAGELAFGTVDTWLIWKLTGGRSHVTDPSNASRTMLFDINRMEWSRELLDIFDIPYTLLPDVVSSSRCVASVEHGSLSGIAVAGVAGDQQAALFGQACFTAGDAKCTYGTGCFLLQNTGEHARASTNHLLTTVGWQIGGRTDYAIEGSVFIGGAVVQWLRDALGVIDNASQVETLAASVPDSGGVYFVPAFTGLGTPHWDQSARGVIVGLTRGTGRAHIARAALDSIAFQTADLLAAMRADSAAELRELRVDGGATANDGLMQFQADVLQMPVVRSEISETTALGAAYLAGLATGFWASKDEIASQWRAFRRYEPSISAGRSAELIDRWHAAVERSLGWEK